MPNGAELFVQSAAHLGIDTVFTLVGDHLNEVLAAAARAGMRIVDMRHESGVTHAADAWARIHRKPAPSRSSPADPATPIRSPESPPPTSPAVR